MQTVHWLMLNPSKKKFAQWPECEIGLATRHTNTSSYILKDFKCPKYRCLSFSPHRILAARPLCTAKLNLCINQKVSRWSIVDSVNIRPTLRTIFFVPSLYVPVISVATNSNWSIRDRLFVRLMVLAAFEAHLALTSLSFTSVDAKIPTRVPSQHRGFPCLNTNMVMSYGFRDEMPLEDTEHQSSEGSFW